MNDSKLWINIENYTGLYEVSNEGEIKSLAKRVKNKDGYRITKERILKPVKDSRGGYLFVTLHKEGKHSPVKIHRIVAKHFVENSNNYVEVNHIDGNKLNNSSSNLEWCNRQQNATHAKKNRLLKTKPVVVVNNSKEYIYHSLNETSKALQVSISYVHSLIKTGKTYKGNKLKYAI